MAGKDRKELVAALIRSVASGQLDAKIVLPAIHALIEDGPAEVSLIELIEGLQGEGGEAVDRLLSHLDGKRTEDALEFHRQRKFGLAESEQLRASLEDLPLEAPLGWVTLDDVVVAVQRVIQLRRDLAFVSLCPGNAPATTALVEERYQAEIDDLSARSEVWANFTPLEVIGALEKLAGEGDADLSRDLGRLKGTLEGQSKDTLADWVTTAPQSKGRKFKSKSGKHSQSVLSAFPAHVSEDALLEALRKEFRAAESSQDRTRVVDSLCAWPTSRAAPLILELVTEPRDQRRVDLILKLRFGDVASGGWDGWRGWLVKCDWEITRHQKAIEDLVQEHPGEIFLVWRSTQLLAGAAKHLAPGPVWSWCEENIGAVEFDDFIERWADLVPREEWDILAGKGLEPLLVEEEPTAIEVSDEVEGELAGGQEATAPLEEPAPGPSPQPEPVLAASVPASEDPGPVEPEEKKTKGPTLWEEHVQPLFSENWYILAGILMVIVGSSLLAFYTWDKHWLIRYTIMPGLLACFTMCLAAMGSWIEKKDSQFRSTGGILRAAAIGLLPVNFMAVALLSGDADVPNKNLVVPAMGAVYLLLGGWGLRRWCGAIHESLGTLLGGSLLVLNSLVVLGPLVESWNPGGDESLPLLIGAGFHLGFFVLAAAVVRFSRKVLTPEVAADKLVGWFLGATLVTTFLQVFAWVHGFIGQLPKIYTYSPLIILSGWLVLFVERRVLELGDGKLSQRAESFLGYALVFLGVLMGASQEYFRIVVFLMAGFIWLYQAGMRQGQLHYWIGLTFLALGGASMGMLEWFPKAWLASIGVGVALCMAVVAFVARRARKVDFARAAIGMQAALLLLSTAVAVLTQWNTRSEPLATAGLLAVIAGLFAWRAYRDQALHWVHSAMVVLAVALPYLGFIDVNGRTLQGNTMIFGLGLLSLAWIGLVRLLGNPIITQARSTVLMLYGGVATAAMLLRVLIERGPPLEYSVYHEYMDYLGPVLMIFALAVATYCSRSMIPAAMAMLIGVILLPELKQQFEETLVLLGWGTGLGSSISALGLVLGCYILRRAAFLKNLGEGDLFLGRDPFPFRRYDHTLFTWVVSASAIFLILKVNTLVFLANADADGLPVKTALALIVSGVCWKLLGVYFRHHRAAVICTHLGWVWLVAGCSFGYWALAGEPSWSSMILLGVLILQSLFFGYRFLLEPRQAWARDLLTEPIRQVLQYGSLLLAAWLVVALMGAGDFYDVWPLIFVVALQLVWHGIETGRLVHGAVLFVLVLTSLLAESVPGTAFLGQRISLEQSLVPALLLLLSVQVLYVLLELLRRPSYTLLQPVLLPLSFGSTLLFVLLAFLGIFVGVDTPASLSAGQLVLLLVVGLLTARAHGSGPIFTLCLFVGYVLALNGAEPWVAFDSHRVPTPGVPLYAALFSLGMSFIGVGICLLARWKPRILAGSLGVRFFRRASIAWVYWPVVMVACLAALAHTFRAEIRDVPIQLLTPYLGAASLGLVAWSWRRPSVLYALSALLLLGNIHAVRIFLGDLLRENGLSEIHLLCLGFALSLLQLSIVGSRVRKVQFVMPLAIARLSLAGLVLLLLSANYFSHPDLASIESFRFWVSGAMAYLASLYFRQAARRAGPFAHLKTWWEGIYHFGVTMAIWCAALSIPALRNSGAALWVLGLPGLYFYLRAELGARSKSEMADRYRGSASVLSFVILALYVFRGIFQMVLFPEDTAIDTGHYHSSAPFIAMVALIMVRLKGLGGTPWLAFYGGLAMMVGSYFSVTSFPGMSPFDYPLQGAWCAIGLAHFWTLFSTRRSPLRTAVQRMGAIDEAAWYDYRFSWGLSLLLATHGAVFWAFVDGGLQPHAVSPLLLGGASLLLHHGFVRKSSIYLALGAAEVMAALHADFRVDSYLQADYVVWVLLGLWGTLLFAPLKIEVSVKARASLVMGALTAAHVIYHHPGSTVGLWAVAVGGILMALTPRKNRLWRVEGADYVAVGLLPLLPAWLVYFSQATIWERGIEGALEAWPVLATTAALFLTGSFARYFQLVLSSRYSGLGRMQPRLFDMSLLFFERSGAWIQKISLLLCLVLVVAVQVTHYDSVFKLKELVLMMGLYAGLGLGCYYEGRIQKSMLAYFILQFCVLAFFLAFRRHLMLATEFWTYEYDVWASLVVSVGLAGSKEHFDVKPAEVRYPLLSTLFALPVLAIAWVLVHGLGPNTALLVVGMQSLIFAYMGRGERESPYSGIAIAGFVSFVLLTFWTKLELRTVPAYVIPVGVGVLVLLQMLRKRITPDARNKVRLVTVLSMLSSTGYYALMDENTSLVFLGVFSLLCLLSMGLGSLLSVRIYLLLGFSGLVVAIAVIFYRVLKTMERGPQMTVIGALVLIVGAALVFGAIYYKTHREQLASRFRQLRKRLDRWE